MRRRDTSSWWNVGGGRPPFPRRASSRRLRRPGDAPRGCGLLSRAATESHASRWPGHAVPTLPASSLFGSVAEASRFFELGSSAATHPPNRQGAFQGLELRTQQWNVASLRGQRVALELLRVEGVVSRGIDGVRLCAPDAGHPARVACLAVDRRRSDDGSLEGGRRLIRRAHPSRELRPPEWLCRRRCRGVRVSVPRPDVPAPRHRAGGADRARAPGLAAIRLSSRRLLWWNVLVAAPQSLRRPSQLARGAGPLGRPPLPAGAGPRRFAQAMAATTTLGVGLSLWFGSRPLALLFEAAVVTALTMLLVGRLCLGSYLFHVLRGQVAFANRTLPWAKD